MTRGTWIVIAVAAAGGCGGDGAAVVERLEIGRPASAAEIAAIDIDVMPDGTGLPDGAGTPLAGSVVYARECASCHGPTGVEGPNDRLVGRPPDGEFPFADDPETRPFRTVGSYWPYATTVFDYVRRAMPQHAPGSLSDDDVYAVTAFLLHRNGLIAESDTMTAATLPAVRMPARERFESAYQPGRRP